VSPSTSAIADTLAALGHVFGELALRWYVFGAQAAIVYGSSRATKDIDITVEPGAVPVSEIIRRLHHAGFTARASDLEELARTVRVIPIEHAATGTPVDVVLAGPGLEESFAANARPLAIAGVEVPVAAAEDLVTMKLLAGRPHDREDVVAILRAQRGTFQIERTREMLTMMEEALDQGDLVASLDAALRRAR
jgi:hypothetical protein